ncbi:hypothetical protein P0136_00485 [Lentisphaerota bacterium ZTH]|nr:hypothetical protein JYG24_08370 [Lentisphaerota bacterium]WET06491.1 hypothetical protein P0136_00485 [Lentisphaerota bacterium ZTH]
MNCIQTQDRIVDLRPRCSLPKFTDFKKIMILDREVDFCKLKYKGPVMLRLLDIPACCEFKVYTNIIKPAVPEICFSLYIQHFDPPERLYIYNRKSFSKSGFMQASPSRILNSWGTMVLKADIGTFPELSAKIKFVLRITELD